MKDKGTEKREGKRDSLRHVCKTENGREREREQGKQGGDED